MNLRSRSSVAAKKTSGQIRTVLGDVGNRVESRIKRNSSKSAAVKKNRKSATNTSSVQLDTDKSDDSSNILANVKESITARRCSSRLNIKRQRDNQPEKEEPHMKRLRKKSPKEISQAHIKKQEDDKCVDRRSHSRHQRHIRISSTDDSKEDEGEVQQYLVHPKFRLRRQSFDCKSFVSGTPAHDESNLDDQLQVVPYVTDLFQHLYREEVSNLCVIELGILL